MAVLYSSDHVGMGLSLAEAEVAADGMGAPTLSDSVMIKVL